MDFSWTDLRTLNGSQWTGFEELCAQLARLETPAGAEFVRKGTPDGGVECFCKLEDGREWGWQAKFFRESLGETQWRQIDRSVETALKSHPRLVRYVVCVPRDRADSRRAGATTELQKWEHRVSTWEGWANERGMEVEFVWWGSSELTSFLLPRPSGWAVSILVRHRRTVQRRMVQQAVGACRRGGRAALHPRGSCQCADRRGLRVVRPARKLPRQRCATSPRTSGRHLPTR